MTTRPPTHTAYPSTSVPPTEPPREPAVIDTTGWTTGDYRAWADRSRSLETETHRADAAESVCAALRARLAIVTEDRDRFQALCEERGLQLDAMRPGVTVASTPAPVDWRVGDLVLAHADWRAGDLVLGPRGPVWRVIEVDHTEVGIQSLDGGWTTWERLDSTLRRPALAVGMHVRHRRTSDRGKIEAIQDGDGWWVSGFYSYITDDIIPIAALPEETT